MSLLSATVRGQETAIYHFAMNSTKDIRSVWYLADQVRYLTLILCFESEHIDSS